MSLQETLVKMTSTAADVNELQNDDSNKSEVSHRSRRSRSSKRSLCKSLSVKSESLSSCKAALQAKQSFEADQRKLLQEEIKAQQRRTALRRQQIALQEEQEQEELKQKALAMERTNLTTRQKLAEIDAAMEVLDDDCIEQDEEVSFKGLREEKKGERMQRFFDSQEKIQTPPLCPDEHQPADSASRLTNPGVPAGWERIATSLEGCLGQLTRVAIGQSAASNQLAVSSQLPRIDVPVFSGDPLKYTLWKNAFDCLIDSKPVSDVSKLNYLNAYVSGKAKEIVEHHLLIGAEDGYQEARRQLEMRFGDPSTIGVSYSRKLSSWPKIASRDAAGLRDFADFLQKVLAAKGKVHSLGILDFPQENVKLVDKLPGHLEGRWRDEVENWRRNQGTQSYPTFSVFAEFVRRAADKANIPELEPLSREHKPNPPASRTKAHIFATTGHSDEPNSINSEISSRARHGPYSLCPYCDGDHPIDACDSFMNKSIEARKAFFRRKMLCLGCGTTDQHLIKNCPDRKKCNTCERPHLTCLHFSQSRSNNNQRREPEEGSLTQVKPEEGTSNCTSVCLVPDQDGRDHCMIVPVWVRHKDQPSKETLEYAILDDQSNVSFISKHLCEKLGVEGKKTNLLLTTMHKTANIESERVSGLEVLDFNKKNVIQLPTAFSRDSVPASRSQIPKPEVVKQWEHLHNIACDMMPYREDVEVSLLIGNDCTRAIRPREIITGGEDDPYAQRSSLGWGVVGRVCRSPGEIKSAACNKTSANTYPNFSFQTKAKETLTASELLQSSRWLGGPTFLHDRGQFQPPIQSEQPTLEEPDPEVKRVSTHSTIAEPEKGFEVDRLRHIPSWSHARNSIALCLRYKRNLQLKVAKTSNFQTVTRPLPKVDLSVADLQEAEMEIIRCLQRESFAAEKAILQNVSAGKESDRKTAKTRNEQIKTASSLYRLDPFIDGEGIIRVGGRINRANVSRELKHPIIIPRQGHVTNLLIRHHHEQINHMGRGITHNHLRQSGYWVIGGSSAVSGIISKCVFCKKMRGSLQQQKMAELPEDRLTPAAPFTYCAVDYFGPFIIKERRSEVKRYGVVFTCMASRAIHLESVNSLSSSSFINCLRRFLSRRGPVRQIRSDRGTAFVGARNELRQALQELDEERVKEYLQGNNVDWIPFDMNTPHSSHMGGTWERQIATVRRALEPPLLSCGNQLDDESFRTFLAEVESIVNSRPLTTSNLCSPDAPEPLTPNHLLTMKPRVVLPPPGKFQHADSYCRKWWRRVQHLTNEFWLRWRKEFLTELQTRQKWVRPQRSVKIGDVVIIKENGEFRGNWPLGRVEKVFPSKDGHVRKVQLRMADKALDEDGRRKGQPTFLDRPIHKLVILIPAEETSQGDATQSEDQRIPDQGAKEQK